MKKTIGIFVCMLVLLGSMIVPQNIDVAATEDYGNPDIDHGYVYNKTASLSQIVLLPAYRNTSRYFGTLGEQDAADLILEWMENIGLENVHLEEITEDWNDYETKAESLYMGPLYKSRVMQDFYLNITIYNTNDWSINDYKNLSWTQCFPTFLKTPPGETDRTEKEDDIPIYENFNLSTSGPQIELGYTHYSTGYTVFETIYESILTYPQGLLPKYRGFIAIDNDTDAFMQFPEQYDQLKFLWLFEKQGFLVNGSVGAWIENAIDDDDLCANASYYTHLEKEDVTSYNVIGQINGTDTNNVSIICAHYDCMINGGTIDEAAETALVLGIAKYIKDHELESDLKHTVKFIGFGGEEAGMRGSKDYILKHIKNKNESENENVTYMINPGNFGHFDRSGQNYYGNPIVMDYELASYSNDLLTLGEDLAEALDFTERTNTTGPGYINISKYFKLRAEDSMIFQKTDSADACIQFGRGPKKCYHRDGLDHTVGDTLDALDNGTFQLECEVVASVALHLLLDLDYQFENCSFVPVDSDGNGTYDSIKVMVNMSTNNNATLFGMAKAVLYNESGGYAGSFNETSLLPLDKGELTSSNLTLLLLPDQPAGNYTANVTLRDPLGDLQDECNQTFYLYPYGKPIAMFSISTSGGKTFSFHDYSIASPGASIDSWNWSFGDGNYSDSQNPVHTYGSSGTFNVTLFIVDSNGLNDSVTHQACAGNDLASVSFSVNSDVVCVSVPIIFTSTSSDSDGSIVNTTWYFGDGTTGYESSMAHSYSQSGIYTVTLMVTDDDGGMNTTTGVVFVAGALVDDTYAGDDPGNHEWDTISEGISDVKDNELLYIFNGVYNSGITINKPISLYGEDEENIVINGTGTAFNIVSDSVVIDGFTVENATIGIHLNGASNSIISNCTILNSNFGIKIENNADQNRIVHCNLINNSYGVFITGSKYNFVGSPFNMDGPVWNDSVFTLNNYGVYLENADENYIMGCMIDATPPSGGGSPPPSTWGVCLDNSDNNTLLFCDVFNASNYGMYMGGSSDNMVMNCLVRENDKGMYLSGSSYNTVIGNNFSENSRSGVNILTMSSTGNSVFWNDFIRNGGGMYPPAEDCGSETDWNTSDNNTFLYGASGEGNFWDDYSGSDVDGDGIGDTSYIIPGTANSWDYYPVMEAYGWVDEWF